MILMSLFMNSARSIFLLFILLSFLQACSGLNDDPIKPVQKSPSDDKKYEYIKLDNGLKVLLISDDAAEFAAVSLDVFVGSGSDPKDRPGLAHFLEHMLFLGTKKYPDAAEYQQFIKRNAGTHNAYTSFEHTNYFFDIKASKLDEGLDRFAQFFIAPSLDENYIDREKNAVDSEYRAKYKDDARRSLDVFKSVINPQHPFTKFSVGSLQSLSDKPDQSIKADLQNFYDAWYSAKNMSLVVLGRQSLLELKQMTIEKFSAIPSQKVADKHISALLFEKNTLPKWVTIQPEKNIRELSLVFPVADQSLLFASKPLTIVGHVLGHEGRGSLFSYLKEKNWAEYLSAGSALNYQGGSTFSVTVGLTEQGLSHQQDVVLAVFQAIKRLQESGIPESMVDDIAKIDALNFAYKGQSAPLNYVMGISNSMHYYPSDKILSAHYLIEAYRPDLIGDVLQRLRLDNALITVVANGFTNVSVTEHYQVPYSVGQLPKKLLADISTVEVNEKILLPLKNDLLPQDLSLMVVDVQQEKPIKIHQSNGLELWHKPLHRFDLPKSTAYYSFQKLSLHADMRSSLLTNLYVGLLNDTLNEWVYSAQMAGLHYGFYAHSRGLTLKLSGFNDKQALLLRQLSVRILAAKFTPEQFQRIKAQWLRQLANTEKQAPYKKLIAHWQVQMQDKKYHASEELAALKTVSLSELNAWAKNIWSGVYIKALNNGNVTPESATAMLKNLQKDLHIRLAENTQPKIAIVKLPEQAFYTQVKVEHDDRGYLRYWQGENNKIETQAKWLLLGKSMEAAYFDELRTQQQLGYIVFANYYPLITVPGLTFIVQSPKASVIDIDKATQKFLQGAKQSIADMSEELFAQYQSALVQKLLEKPKKLVQESNAYWSALALGDLSFDRKERLAQQILKLTLSEWQVYVNNTFNAYPGRSYLFATESGKKIQAYLPGIIQVNKSESPGDIGEYIYR